jgi:hypothetical protein
MPGNDPIHDLTGLSLGERVLRARMGGYARAAKYDGTEVTEKARRTFDDRFYEEVDPEQQLPPAERERRVAAARKRYFTELAYKSARSRAAMKTAGTKAVPDAS